MPESIVADDAGALLVRSGLVSPSALEQARAAVANGGGTIGEQLVATGAIADDALTDFYHQRLLVPQVNPNTLARLPIRVVAAIPSDMAVELRAIPVSIDGDNNLTVAMSDPSDSHAVDEIAFFTGAYVVRAVATQMQIAWCLAHYYGHITALGQRLLQPAEPDPVPSKAHAAPPSSPARGPDATGEPRTKVMPPGSELDPLAVATDLTPLAQPSTNGVAASPQRGDAPLAPDDQPERRAPRPVRERASSQDDTIRPGRAKAITLPEDEPSPGPAPIPAPDDDTDRAGTPKPRPRSISGEIRVPSRRAASIRPPMPDPHEPDDDDDGDDDEPLITVEPRRTEDEETAPRMVPVRRRRAKTDPPELAARAGEVDVVTGPVRKVDLVVDEPRIIISDEPSGPQVSGEMRVVEHRDARVEPAPTIEVADDTTGVIIHEHPAHDSEPVLLDRKRPNSPAPTAVRHRARVLQAQRPPSDLGDDSDVVELQSRKPAHRPVKSTQVGIGANPASRRFHDTELTGVPQVMDDLPTVAERRAEDADTDQMRIDGNDATRVDTTVAPSSADDISDEIAEPPAPRRPGDDTSPRIKPPPPGSRAASVPGRTIHPRATTSDEEEGSPTSVMTAAELDDVIPERDERVVPAHLEGRSDDVDDGWGPPGTTIPPPLLGAMPGSEDDAGDGEARIPMGNIDSAPLIVAPPAAPERPSAVRDITSPTLVRALEEATARTLDLIRDLERQNTRDHIIHAMIAHLADSHRRAGFFSIKSGELAVFAIQPRPELIPVTTLRLDRPSTLQDVVGTRLPYRGPMHDDASRHFLAAALGACPPEILLVPVTVRDRVVGVLFGEQRLRHTFDDQIALAARAAGMALERVLKTRRP